MKKTSIIFCINVILTFTIVNNTFAATPTQRAAMNIWLQQQYDINPLPVELITALKDNTKNYTIKIYNYKINAKTIEIKAKTSIKSNILRYKRILDTTFLFDEIIISHQKKNKKNYYFKFKLKKSNALKRGIYEKSKQKIFKSKTQIKHTIRKLITNFQTFTRLKKFCPSPALKIKPHYVGARIKLLIYSYHITLSSSFNNVKKILNRIANNAHYISMHNINLTTNKKEVDIDLDIRFYQQANRRNNLDKAFAFKKVATNKICK